MKRLFPILLMLFCFFQVKAEEPATAEYRAAFQTHIMNFPDTTSGLSQVIDEAIVYTGQTVTPEQAADIKKTSMEKLLDLMVPIYAQHITLEELKVANADPQNFYSTTEGAILQEKEDNMLPELEKVLLPWSEWIVQYIFEVSSKNK